MTELNPYSSYNGHNSFRAKFFQYQFLTIFCEHMKSSSMRAEDTSQMKLGQQLEKMK